MAKPRDVVVRFLADTRDFLRGTDNVERSFRDMARDADHVADEGEDSARRLARAYDRAGDQIRQDTRRTTSATTDAYAEGGREAGAEFAQNIGESISSGDLSGTLSGTIGGLVGTFGQNGPIGLALAGLGAVAVGVFTSITAQAQKAQEAAQAAFDQLHDQTSKEATLNAILTDKFGSTLEGWEQIARYSEASGVSADVIAEALVKGGQFANDIADRQEDIARQYYNQTGQLDIQTGLQSDLADLLHDRVKAMDRAAAAAQTERDALAASEGILKRSAKYYAARGSAYATGGSTYSSQVPRYTGGKRS